MPDLASAVHDLASEPKSAAADAALPITSPPSSNGTLSNWNKSYSFQPAKLVEPAPGDIVKIQEVVRDTSTYPSPVIALGSQHTVNQAMVNANGTVIQLFHWKEIFGLEDRRDELVPGLGKKVVRLQPGVTMLQLHYWLDDQGYECSFSPEIGDATVGSLASCTSKDSSIGAPGYFSALVATVKYVDHKGNVVTIDRGTDPGAMEEYSSSFSMKGIAVELTVVVRPRTLVKTVTTAYAINEELPAKLLELKAAADNIWAIVDLEACTVEQRWGVGADSLTTPQFIVEAYREYRYTLFLEGHNGLLSTTVPRFVPLTFINHRFQFVNHYPEVTADQERLDFSYFEYPRVETFEATLTQLLAWLRRYKADTGFTPGALVIYFVNRTGEKAQWPQLNYGGPAGYSFVCDPIYGRPDDPKWIRFCTDLLPVAQALGARPGGSQTKQLLTRPAFFPLPRSFSPSERFLTPYFSTFLQDLQPQPPT